MEALAVREDQTNVVLTPRSSGSKPDNGSIAEIDENNCPCRVSIEMPNTECKLSRLLNERGIRLYEVMDYRVSSEGKVRHLVKVQNTSTDKKGNCTAKRVGQTYWFETEGCKICQIILGHDSFLVSKKQMNEVSCIYTFTTANHQKLNLIMGELENAGLKPKLLRMENCIVKDNILTDKQERALLMGYESGYFAYPRRTSTEKLAKSLGIRAGSASEMVRRGLHALLEEYFNG